MKESELAAATIADFKNYTAGKKYKTIYADPPWQFQNRKGKVATEHKRLSRHGTLTLNEIKKLTVADSAAENRTLDLWIQNGELT